MGHLYWRVNALTATLAPLAPGLCVFTMIHVNILSKAGIGTFILEFGLSLQYILFRGRSIYLQFFFYQQKWLF